MCGIRYVASGELPKPINLNSSEISIFLKLDNKEHNADSSKKSSENWNVNTSSFHNYYKWLTAEQIKSLYQIENLRNRYLKYIDFSWTKVLQILTL